MGAARTARRKIEKAQPTKGLPGIGMVVDAETIDALLGLGLQTQQGTMLFHGWRLAKGLPVDVVYTVKAGAGEITGARKAKAKS